MQPTIQRIVAEYSLALWFLYLTPIQRKWILYIIARKAHRRWYGVRYRIVG